MRSAASLSRGADGTANATAAAGGPGGSFPVHEQARLQPPPPPPDGLPALKLLQDGDLFGGVWPGGSDEMPLLVPIPNGAITNLFLDESYGEPQEALIERYLALMGLAPRPPPAAAAPPGDPKPPVSHQGGAEAAYMPTTPEPNGAGLQSPAPAVGVSSAEAAAGAEGLLQEQEDGLHDNEEQDDADLLLSVHRPRRPPPPPYSGSTPALVALGMDRSTLSRRGIPESLIGALYRGLAANAASFFRTCVAEQRRLVALTQGSGPAVPLADRLLAFITGAEGHLKDGSAMPDPVELRVARDNQAILDAVSPLQPGPPVPFHHELVHQRQQAAVSPPAADQVLSTASSAPCVPPLDELLDMDKVTALATAGNVPGLRALLRSLVTAADYTRTSLLQRLKAEGERAERECARSTEARQAAARLREQLAARNAALAERGAELEAACRRATAAEEALVTERSIAEGLRGQLRQLTVDYEAQHRQLRAGLEAHLTRPSSAKLVAHAIGVSSEGGHGHGHGSGSSDSDVHLLSSQLASMRAELALAELTCAQERASARQLRVMLESARGSLDLEAGRAAAAHAEVERLNRLVSASHDLASASTGGIATLEHQLALEKAAHRRTMERLQASSWKFEQARSSVVDVRSRAAHSLRKLQTALADVNLRAVTAERQLADANVHLMHARGELQATKDSLEALRDRSERQDQMIEVLRNEAAAARIDGRELGEKLKETEAALRKADARVTQLQQKVMEDADTVMAGRKASERLEVLEKEHSELEQEHQALRAAHTQLTEDHDALQRDMSAARQRIAELEVKEAHLVELTAQHEELKVAKNRLDTQYASVVKAKTLLSAELAGLKRHADVLAEQVQEYRRLADGARLALEEEKEMHRHTREELAMTASRRDQLEARCADLSATLEGTEIRMKAADDEAQRCRRVAELAGHQRAEAFAMRDAMMKVRIALTCEVKEYLADIETQVRQMGKTVEELRGSLTTIQSRLLDLDPTTLAGTSAEIPKVSYEESRQLVDALFKMVSHGSQLLETQAEVRKALVERIDQLEDGIKDRLATATDYWRQVLVLSRSTPRSMVQVVQHLTGQACKELDLDPFNPLARMVPLGVLEEAGIQLNTQHERAGWLRDRADESKAKGDAATKLLEYERQASSARASEFQALVDTLSREVNRLKARVSSLEANNVMQQRATADMQRMLNDAEWKVAKAQEREVLLGIKFMVPHGRDTKAVQTVFSDLYIMTGPVPPALSLPSSLAAQLTGASPSQPLTRSQLLHSRSMGAQEMTATEALGELAEEDGRVDESAPENCGGGMSGAPDGGADAPGSPASLPPVSSLSSPTRTPQPPASVPSRPQSNLARSSSAVGSGPPTRRCASPDLSTAPGTEGRASAAPPENSAGGSGPQLTRAAFVPVATSPFEGPTGRLTSASAVSSSSAVSTAQGRPSQRRRHPDEAPRRSAGSALSPVPSLNSMHSLNSVVSDMLGSSGGGGVGAGGRPARGVSGAGGPQDLGYTSDGNAAAAAALEASNSEDEFASPSPSTSPPLLLRTPSATATAAAAAAFAATGKGGSVTGSGGLAAAPSPSPSLHSRPATAGPPSSPWAPLAGFQSHPLSPSAASGQHHYYQSHTARLSGPALHSRPASPVIYQVPSPPTPSGIPHGWQHTPWDWLPDVAPLTRGAVPYSRQALLEVIADIHYTKGLHDQVAAAAAFPATSMQQYIGAYFEARHGPRGSSPPAAEQALAQLLVSLEAHSALYEVMLFARVAGLQVGLQIWTGKGVGRNSSSSVSRPNTAQAPRVSAGGSFVRPRTSRVESTLSPYASSALSPSRPGTAASVAAARNSRTLSARTSAAPGSGSVLLGLMPSSRPSTAASPNLGMGGASGTVMLDVSDLTLQTSQPAGSGGVSAVGGSVPGGETVMRLRTGLSPAIVSTGPGSSGGGGGYVSTSYTPFAQVGNYLRPPGGPRRTASTAGLPGTPSSPRQSLQPPAPPPQLMSGSPPRPQLRVRPEVLVSEQLSQLLGRLGDVSGMEALSQFISTGRLLGRLRQADLGQPLPENMHPELYFTVQMVCSALGLQETPELFVRPLLPYGLDVMLLQVPHVATGSFVLLAQGDVDRQPVPSPAAAPSAAAGGWRRRAVLLLTPALVAAVVPAVAGEPASEVDGEELQCLLGAALTPMAMPGGVGWRLDVQGAGAKSSGGNAVNGGAGGTVSGPTAPPSAAPASATSCSATLLSAAEVITVANVAALKGKAAPSVLPSQLQFKWERLLTHLRGVAAVVSACADRGALLATQSMAPAVRAVFRAAAGLPLHEGVQLGTGEELVLQAQTLPMSDDELLSKATIPMHDVAAAGGETRRGFALARVAILTRWAEGVEYRQTLRSAVM